MLGSILHSPWFHRFHDILFQLSNETGSLWKRPYVASLNSTQSVYSLHVTLPEKRSTTANSYFVVRLPTHAGTTGADEFRRGTSKPSNAAVATPLLGAPRTICRTTKIWKRFHAETGWSCCLTCMQGVSTPLHALDKWPSFFLFERVGNNGPLLVRQVVAKKAASCATLCRIHPVGWHWEPGIVKFKGGAELAQFCHPLPDRSVFYECEVHQLWLLAGAVCLWLNFSVHR